MEKKPWRLSYASRRTGHEIWTYDGLCNEVLCSKQDTIDFLTEKGLLKRTQLCPKCSEQMEVTKCSENDAIEEVQFRCQKRHFNSSTQGSHGYIASKKRKQWDHLNGLYNMDKLFY